jgi:hypothetical protein
MPSTCIVSRGRSPNRLMEERLETRGSGDSRLRSVVLRWTIAARQLPDS